MNESHVNDEHWLLSAAGTPAQTFDQIQAWLLQHPDLITRVKVDRAAQRIAFRASAEMVGALKSAFPTATLKVEPDSPLELFQAGAGPVLLPVPPNSTDRLMTGVRRSTDGQEQSAQPDTRG